MLDADGQYYYGPAICPKCSLTVYHAEWVVFNGEAYHQSCFICGDCRRNLNSSSCRRVEGKLLCNACFSKGYGMKGYGYGGAVVSDIKASNKANEPLTGQAHCYPQMQNGYLGFGAEGHWPDPCLMGNTSDQHNYSDAYQQHMRQVGQEAAADFNAQLGQGAAGGGLQHRNSTTSLSSRHQSFRSFMQQQQQGGVPMGYGPSPVGQQQLNQARFSGQQQGPGGNNGAMRVSPSSASHASSQQYRQQPRGGAGGF